MGGDDLIIIDQLYGAVTIPAWLKPVVFSPELQRLREVRLINTTSPSCSALSDARRFTHTLGVLHLASHVVQKIYRDWSKEEGRAFLVSALLHDIGTPAFGHLFEYQLASIKGWNHEKFVLDLIRGTYRLEKRRHQIYYNNSLQLSNILKTIDVDVDMVVNMVNGKSVLGTLLAGFIDLDNIDNVFRMAALLGLHPDNHAPVQLVSHINPEATGVVFDEEILPLLSLWRELRRRTYEILAFDEQCLSGQAMLTDCLTIALNSSRLSDAHWYFTDEQLLRELLDYEETKEIIQRFAIGDFYQQVYLEWYDRPKGNIDLRHPSHRATFIESVKRETNIVCSPYIFYDSGTFSKKLNLNIRSSDESLQTINFGEKSESTIVSIFTQKRISESEQKRLHRFLKDFLVEYGLNKSDRKIIPAKQNTYEIPGQRAISFGT